MPLLFTSAPATASATAKPLAAPFWAAGADADYIDGGAGADADYIGGAGRSPSSLSPIPEDPEELRRLSPAYAAGTPPPDGPDAGRSASLSEAAEDALSAPTTPRLSLLSHLLPTATALIAAQTPTSDGPSVSVPSPADAEVARLTTASKDAMTDEAFVRKVAETAAQRGVDVYTPDDTIEKKVVGTPSPTNRKPKSLWSALRGAVARHEAPLLDEG